MENLSNIIESIIFVSGNAVAIKDIAEKLEVKEDEITAAVKELQKTYGGNCGIHLLMFNKKLQFSSNPGYAENVSNVLNPIKERELSRAMLETAAIIAYKQPITRLELEEIRGVNSDYSVQMLLNLNVIEVVGRKDAIGRPVLFGTTDEFLKRFQLSSLNDLPDYDTLMEKIKLIHANDSDYLYNKPVYNEEEDPEAAKASGRKAKGAGKVKEAVEKAEESIAAEEVPDFLKDEDIEIVS